MDPPAPLAVTLDELKKLLQKEEKRCRVMMPISFDDDEKSSSTLNIFQNLMERKKDHLRKAIDDRNGRCIGKVRERIIELQGGDVSIDIVAVRKQLREMYTETYEWLDKLQQRQDKELVPLLTELTRQHLKLRWNALNHFNEKMDNCQKTIAKSALDLKELYSYGDQNR